MTTPFIVTKPTKSTGIAVLLTFLLGPIGLFYASISGGLIMTFAPILLVLLFLVGLFVGSPLILGWSIGLIIIFAATYWLICIIWAIISVRTYNYEVEADARRQFDLWNRHQNVNTTPNQFVVNINQKGTDKSINRQELTERLTKPSLQEWLKSNPGKSINDYFVKFGR